MLYGKIVFKLEEQLQMLFLMNLVDKKASVESRLKIP